MCPGVPPRRSAPVPWDLEVTGSNLGSSLLQKCRLVKLLESKEANHIEFCRIKNVVDEILQMHRNNELSVILRILLKPAWLATGLKVDYDILIVYFCDVLWLCDAFRDLDHRLAAILSMDFVLLPHEATTVLRFLRLPA
ncbi:hypothetical protein KSP40_PGU021701 [Platanthera guangdongensis]|uniref:Uncharacterized protein n=1 Tax=Platanthera guangdongensis TaxID=2320717 RepID=A0ABR2LYX2_9ASPA